MGRYATTTSISVLMPNFLVGNTTSSDTEGISVWSTACDRAEAQVNSAVVARYDPSTWTNTGSPAFPPMIIKLTQDLACLYAIRSAITQDAQVKNAAITDWERAEATLEEIKNGTLKLAYTDGSLVPTRSTKILNSTAGYNHIFAMDNERHWRSGTNEQDAITAERDGGSP